MTDADVPQAPAPWQLRGKAYVSLIQMPERELNDNSFLPDSLRGRRLPGRFSLMMFVDYQRSDVGPYQELLFIPGRFTFADGRRHASISRIFVSTEESVVNGRRNWGIPKEKAEFDVRYGNGSPDRVSVSLGGKSIVRLSYRSWLPALPFNGHFVPPALRTLGQHHEGRTYIYTPVSIGLARFARLLSAEIDPAQFPDIRHGRVLGTAHLSRFRINFPPSRILPEL